MFRVRRNRYVRVVCVVRIPIYTRNQTWSTRTRRRWYCFGVVKINDSLQDVKVNAKEEKIGTTVPCCFGRGVGHEPRRFYRHFLYAERSVEPSASCSTAERVSSRSTRVDPYRHYGEYPTPSGWDGAGHKGGVVVPSVSWYIVPFLVFASVVPRVCVPCLPPCL